MSANGPVPREVAATRLIRNSLWNVTAYFFYLGLGVLSLPLFLKYLGHSHYGVLVLLGSLTAPLGLLNFGFGQATVKFVAENLARKDVKRAARYVSNTLLFNLCSGAAGALALVLLAPLLATRLFRLAGGETPLIEACVRWTALTWVAVQAGAAFVAVPTAQQRFRVVSLGTMIFSTANLLLSMAPLLAGYGLLAVVKIRFLWSLAGVLGWMWIARRIFPQMPLLPAYERGAFRSSLGFGIWQTTANLGGLLANQSDKYLLGIYLSAEAVGLFNIPFLIFSTLFSVVSKLSEATFPAISDLQGRGQHAKAVAMLLHAGAWISLFMVCLQGTVFIFAGDILRLYVGPEIAESAARVLRIFAVTAVIAAPSVMVNQYLLGTGATAWIAMTAAASGLLTLLVSWILVPRFGLAGAAWSDLIAILLSRPLSHWALWRGKLRTLVGGRRFVLALYGMSMLGLPATLTLGWARQQMTWQPGWLGLLLGLAIAVGLLGSLLLLGARRLRTGPGHLDGLVELIRHLRTRSPVAANAPETSVSSPVTSTAS